MFSIQLKLERGNNKSELERRILCRKKKPQTVSSRPLPHSATELLRAIQYISCLFPFSALCNACSRRRAVLYDTWGGLRGTNGLFPRRREEGGEEGRRRDLCPNLSSQDYESPLSPLCLLLSVSTHPFSRFLSSIDCPRFAKDAKNSTLDQIRVFQIYFTT